MTRSQDDDLRGAAGVSAADEPAEAVTTEQDQDYAETIGEGPPPLRPRWQAPDPEDNPGWEFDIPRAVAPFLKADETRVIPMRQHLVKLIPSAVVGLGGLLAAIALNGWAYSAGRAAPLTVHIIWWLWLAGLAWAIWRWLEWRQTWFVVTGHRVIFIECTHMLGRHVSMLPIPKLRDMKFDQTSLGRALGYGTLDFASIGTEKALDLVPYLPYPEWLYQEISALIMPDADRRAVNPRTRK